MDAAECSGSSSTKKKTTTGGGVHCIAPGCTNHFYKGGKQHFHRLPLKNEVLLKTWLQKLKRKNPPVNEYARVCSEHFVQECYEEKREFDESGALVTVQTNKLRADAVPTILNLSSFPCGVYDVTTKQAPKATARVERSLARKKQKQQTEVTASVKLLTEAHHSSGHRSSADVDNAIVDTFENVQTEDHDEPCRACHRRRFTSTHSVGVQTDSVERVCVSVATCDIERKSVVAIDHGYAVRESLLTLPQHSALTPVVTAETEPAGQAAHDMDCNQLDTLHSVMIMDNDDSQSLSDGLESLDDHASDKDYEPESSPSSSSESECSDSESGSTSEDKSVIGTQKLIVFQDQLLELFRFCQFKGCAKPLIEEPVVIEKGFAVSVRTSCIDGHDFKWYSQPSVNGISACNLLVPAAIFITGNSYTNFLEMCDLLKIQALCPRHCYNMQSVYIIPEVESMWQIHNTAVLAALDGTKLVVSGDGRHDSPGHCASQGTYTLLEESTSLIVAQESIHVTEVANSYWLEMEGLKRCLGQVLDHSLTIHVLATDRHPGIQKFLRDTHPTIMHQNDLWHIVKGVKKKLAKRKIPELTMWIQHVGNHLWYCASTCNGDALILKEKWTSLLFHVTNRHHWVTGEKIHKCDHAEYSEADQQTRVWLEEGSKGFTVLQAVVMDKRLLKSLSMVTEGIHTGQLESIHSLYTKYAPKRKKFSQLGMQARLRLAALDHNDHIDRKHAETHNGILRFKLQYSKPSATYVTQPIKVVKSYNFRTELLRGVFNRCEGSTDSLRQQCAEYTKARSRVKHKTLGEHAGLQKPGKSEAIAKKMSRFSKAD